MKKISLIISLVIYLMTTTSGLFGQSKSDKLFDAFRNKEGFTYFSVNKNMKDAFNIDLDDEDKTLTGDLHEIKFLSYKPDKGNFSGPSFINKAARLLPAAYDKLKLEGDDNNAIIWKLGNKKKVSEFHVFIKNDSPSGMHFLISFFGDFNINDADGIKEIGLSFSDN